MKNSYTILFTLLAAALWIGCDKPYDPIGDDDTGDDDAADDDTGDDDAQGDDDDAQGDDDDAQGDDDDAQGDDDDAQGDDDDATGQDPCADQGGVTVTFNTNPPIMSCNTTWTEAGVSMVVVSGGPCPQDCGTMMGGEMGEAIGLWPGQLQMDLSGIGCDATQATVIATPWGGAAEYETYDANMSIIDQGNLTQGQSQSTVIGTLGGTPMLHLYIGMCEGMVEEVTFM